MGHLEVYFHKVWKITVLYEPESHWTQGLLMPHESLSHEEQGIISLPGAWNIMEKSRWSFLQPWDVLRCLRTSHQGPTHRKQ